MKRRSRMPLASSVVESTPEWAYPHEDAEIYIRDFLSQALNVIAFQEQKSFDDQVEEGVAYDEYEENLSDEEREEHEGAEGAWARMQHQYEKEWDDYEGIPQEDHDAPEDIHLEEAAEIHERVEAANDALARGDVEDLVSALGPLAEFGSEELDVDGLFNWSLLLADSVARRNPVDRRSLYRQDVATAVYDLCESLCHIVARDGAAALQQMEWRQLEHLVAHALAGLGFAVTLTPSSKDGGRDVVATCQLVGQTLTYFVEVKHWRSKKKVGEQQIFDFVEVNAFEGTDGGVLISTSGFAVPLLSQLAELSQEHVRLGGETKVVTLCQQFVRRGHGLWTSPQTLPEILFEHTLGHS